MFSKKTVENLIKRISQKALTNRMCYDIILLFQIRRHGQAVRQRSATPLSPVRFWVAPPKNKALLWKCFIFCVCVRRTQHRLSACGQHHFEQSENIVFNKRTQNEVTPYGVNDVAFGKQCCASHKRCELTLNDVALRANIMLRIDLLPLLCYNTLKGR